MANEIPALRLAAHFDIFRVNEIDYDLKQPGAADEALTHLLNVTRTYASERPGPSSPETIDELEASFNNTKQEIEKTLSSQSEIITTNYPHLQEHVYQAASMTLAMVGWAQIIGVVLRTLGQEVDLTGASPPKAPTPTAQSVFMTAYDFNQSCFVLNFGRFALSSPESVKNAQEQLFDAIEVFTRKHIRYIDTHAIERAAIEEKLLDLKGSIRSALSVYITSTQGFPSITYCIPATMLSCMGIGLLSGIQSRMLYEFEGDGASSRTFPKASQN